MLMFFFCSIIFVCISEDRSELSLPIYKHALLYRLCVQHVVREAMVYSRLGITHVAH